MSTIEGRAMIVNIDINVKIKDIARVRNSLRSISKVVKELCKDLEAFDRLLKRHVVRDSGKATAIIDNFRASLEKLSESLGRLGKKGFKADGHRDDKDKKDEDSNWLSLYDNTVQAYVNILGEPDSGDEQKPSSGADAKKPKSDTKKSILGRLFKGIKHELDVLRKKFEDTFDTGKEVADKSVDFIEKSLMKLFDKAGGRLKYIKALAKNTLNEILKILLRNLVVRPLIGSIISHLPFNRGQSFHSGGFVFGYSEIPAILQSGEYVVSRRGVEFLDRINAGTLPTQPNVVVNVVNNTSMPVNAEKKTPKFDGKQFVVDVILKDIEGYGPIRHAIQGVK